MKAIDCDLLQRLSAQAVDSDRRRANYNFHPEPADGVQRFCNAIEPGSYVRPHRHPAAGRWEFVLALRGAEIPGGTWHTLAAREPGAAGG